MYLCDELIYIQLQKTGCTHIAALLGKLFSGEQIGKHNAATEEMLGSGRFVLASIRNPWDWYLSLWSYGVQGEGALKNRLTKRRFLRAIADGTRNRTSILQAFKVELLKNVSLWSEVYNSSGNVASFREWLKQIHSVSNRHLLGEGYGESSVSEVCGFMTYRYLSLCCKNVEQLSQSQKVINYSDVMSFDRSNCYIDTFVRQEMLEDSLAAALSTIRNLTDAEKHVIYSSKRTNASKRSKKISDYYDPETIELVRDRDRLIVDKFKYRPPEMS